MRIVKASFRNIMGIEDMTIVPGAFTLFEGDNAEGKSSGLEAIKYLVAKGHDPDMLRTGAETGEIRADLDDGRTIVAILKPDDTHRDVILPHGGKAGRAAALLAQMHDQVSVNPLAFLLAAPKEQAQLLLETMPLHVDPAKVEEAAGVALTAEDLSGDALEVLDRVRTKVYDERTALNRLAKANRAAAERLTDALGEEPPTAPDVTALRGQVYVTTLQERTGRTSNREELDRLKAAATGRADAKIREVREALQLELDALRENAQARLEEVLEPLRSRSADLEAQIKTADDLRQRWEGYQTTRKLRDDEATQALEYETEAGRLTEALARLDQLKADLLATLPIKGLEIRDGKIYLDGVSFRRTNTARRIAFGLTISALRAPPDSEGLRVVIVDDLSHFGAKNFAELERALLASGLQFFGGRVTDGPLQVTTKG